MIRIKKIFKKKKVEETTDRKGSYSKKGNNSGKNLISPR